MKAKGSENRSARATKEKLVAAMLQLLAEKPAREISVRELTQLAKVSRGTFYFHYDDIYDLISSMEETLLSGLQRVVDTLMERLEGNTHGATPQTLYALFRYLEGNETLCRALLGPNGDPVFVRRFRDVVEQQCLGSMGGTRRYQTAFAVAGCIGIVEKWLQEGKHRPAEEMADLTWRTICAVRTTPDTVGLEKD